MKRLHRKREKHKRNEFAGSGPTVFECPMDYQPGRAYTRADLIALITPHRELLCFFAQCARVERCVLGIDFDRYDQVRHTVPVYVLDEVMAERIANFEGCEFQRAYRTSRCGRDVIVTFTGEWWRGWCVLEWQLPEQMVESRGGDGVD
jgi:hypothetical protein